jgi:GT2 family glycosyltransferase
LSAYNGSEDDSVSMIHKCFPSITLLETGKNLGYARGNNVGICHALTAGAEYLLLLNNDTIVDPDILKGFLKTYETHPDASILGAKTCLYNERNRLDHLGGIWNSRKGKFDLIGVKEHAENWKIPILLDYACGCALFIKTEVIKRVGELEPRFFLFWEESDFCFRAKKEGFFTYFSPEAKLFHKVSASFKGGKPETTYYWWRGRLLFIERSFSPAERFSLTFRTLLPEIGHLFKLYLLKKTQLFLLKHLKPTTDRSKQEEKLSILYASLLGVKDYLFRRFNSCPHFRFGAKS